MLLPLWLVRHSLCSNRKNCQGSVFWTTIWISVVMMMMLTTWKMKLCRYIFTDFWHWNTNVASQPCWFAILLPNQNRNYHLRYIHNKYITTSVWLVQTLDRAIAHKQVKNYYLLQEQNYRLVPARLQMPQFWHLGPHAWSHVPQLAKDDCTVSCDVKPVCISHKMYYIPNVKYIFKLNLGTS